MTTITMIDQISQRLRQLPEKRVYVFWQLLQMLDEVEELPQKQPAKQKTLKRALGLAANSSKAPPTDAEVKQWLAEYHMEKYG